MKSLQITRLQLFEMINKLFADTVVICHPEKLPNNLLLTIKQIVDRDSIPDK